MEKKIVVLLCFLFLLFLPNPAVSDCTDLGRASRVYVRNDKTIIFYAQNTPIAQIVLEDCSVSSSSDIRLLKSYVCDSDRIVVDGQECAIMTLTLGSAP